MNNNNVSTQEIDKFSELSQQWWDKSGKMRTLHDINPLRVQFIQQQVDLTSKTVIDIGCGGGILSESLAQQQATVTGIDLAETLLEVAKQHSQQAGLSINYQCISAEDMAEKAAGQFNVVTCLEMLEHVPDPAAIVQACAKLLKPDGQLFFSTLNRTLKAYLFAILGAEYVLKLIPRGTHQYDQFIRPAELDKWLRESGLSLKTITGFSYNPLTHTAQFSKDVGVNYLVHCVPKAYA